MPVKNSSLEGYLPICYWSYYKEKLKQWQQQKITDKFECSPKVYQQVYIDEDTKDGQQRNKRA